MSNTQLHKPKSYDALRAYKHFVKTQNRMVNLQATRTWISFVLEKSRAIFFSAFVSFYRFPRTFQSSFAFFARQSLCFPLVLCARNLCAEGQNWSSRVCLTFDHWVCGNNFKWNLFCSIYEFSNLYLTVCQLFNYCSCWEEQSFCHCIHHDECAMYDGNVIYAVVQEIAGSSGLHSRASESTLDSTSFRSLIVFYYFFDINCKRLLKRDTFGFLSFLRF